MAVETALDWFRRSSKKRRRHRHSKSGPNNDDDDVDDDESLNANITTATDAAWTFLRYGRSGIAPIDAAWKRCRWRWFKLSSLPYIVSRTQRRRSCLGPARRSRPPYKAVVHTSERGSSARQPRTARGS